MQPRSRGFVGAMRDVYRYGSRWARSGGVDRNLAIGGAVAAAGLAASNYIGYGPTVGSSGSGGAYLRRRAETKYFDLSDGPITVSATGSMNTSLNLVPIGTGPDERIGAEFRIVGVQLQGIATVTDTTGAMRADVLRCVVYWDKQCNGAAAAATDILASASILSHNKLENSLRFKTLAQFTISLQPEGCSGTNTTVVKRGFKRNVRCSIPVVMDIGTALSNVRSNNIGIMWISNNGLCTVTYRTRIRFKDA